MAKSPSKRPGVARRKQEEAKLTLTSMMDMFTIILVFLMKSYSTDVEVNVDASMAEKLPVSISESKLEQDAEAVVQITPNAILVKNKHVVTLQNFKIPKNALDPTNPFLIVPLYDELNNLRETALKLEEAGAIVKGKPYKFQGILVIKGDKNMPSSLLMKVMYTAGQAEFAKIYHTAVKEGG